MASHNNLGREGEELAIAKLINLGYRIVAQNWRYSHWEIDIIAEKEGIIHFVEVKTRSSAFMGFPEEAVTEKKLRNLIDASEIFCEQNPQWEKIQFDILAITIIKNNVTYFFIEDVFI